MNVLSRVLLVAALLTAALATLKCANGIVEPGKSGLEFWLLALFTLGCAIYARLA